MSLDKDDYVYYNLTPLLGGCELTTFTFRDEQPLHVFESKMRVRTDGTA